MGYKDPEKQRAYQRWWMQRRRIAWTAMLGPCRDCGSWDDLEIRYPERGRRDKHTIWSMSWPKRREVLAQCYAVCWRCRGQRIAKKLRLLPLESVREIRQLTGKVTQVELAQRYGVSRRTIRRIQSGERYKDEQPTEA